MEARWTERIIPKLRGIDVKRLSGGATGAQAALAADDPVAAAVASNKKARRNDDGAVSAARARFLARKKLKSGGA